MPIDPRLLFLMRRAFEAKNERFKGIKTRFLDIGCADGSFIKAVLDSGGRGVEIDGVDVPSRWLKAASAESGCSIYIQDLQKGIGGMEAGRYHIATMWEVIEHVENVHEFLRNVRALLAPGGMAMLSSPNLLSLSRFIKGDRWVGTSEQDHKYLFDAKSLRMVLSRAGFRDIDVKGIFLPSMGPFFDWGNKLLSKSPGGGMLLAKAFKSELT